MDKVEASAIAHEWLERLRREPYASLAAQVDQAPVTEQVARSGLVYQVEIMYLWDNHRGGDVRVIVAVDDGGLRAFVPLTSDFIKAPDGHFVGE